MLHKNINLVLTDSEYDVFQNNEEANRKMFEATLLKIGKTELEAVKAPKKV